MTAGPICFRVGNGSPSWELWGGKERGNTAKGLLTQHGTYTQKRLETRTPQEVLSCKSIRNCNGSFSRRDGGSRKDGKKTRMNDLNANRTVFHWDQETRRGSEKTTMGETKKRE